jgi:hypothetical protein
MSEFLTAVSSLLFWAAVFSFFWRRAERRKMNPGPGGDPTAGDGPTPSAGNLPSPQTSEPGSRSTRLSSQVDEGGYPTYLQDTTHPCDTTHHHYYSDAGHCDPGHPH